MPTLIQIWRSALGDPHCVDGARTALALFKSYCAEQLPRVPGMATGDRLAIRIHAGRSVEEAAAREYLYRWNLAIKAPDQCIPAGDNYRDRNPRACLSVFGAPHAIGL